MGFTKVPPRPRRYRIDWYKIHEMVRALIFQEVLDRSYRTDICM
jgi:hypothetical protein